MFELFVKRRGFPLLAQLLDGLSCNSEEDVEGIRTGAIGDPTVGQVAALANVFGVEPSYLLDREEPPFLDAELVQALRDADVRDITREFAATR